MSDRCHIIRDMLPLYLDGMLSEDSVGFVEEHLQGCGACREELEKLKAPDDFPRETPERDAAALKTMKRKWNRRVVLLGILLAAAVLAALAGSFFAHHWIGTAREDDAEALAKRAERYLKTADGRWYMCEYDRDSVFADRWRANGGSSGSDGFTVGEMHDWLFGSPQEAVMIYCGVGLPEEAKWYAFRNDDITYICLIEGDVILDVFVVSGGDMVTASILLDEEKEPLKKNSDLVDYVLQREN